MTDFRDILYFYPEKVVCKTYFFNQGVSFLSAHKNDAFRGFFAHTNNFKVRDFAILDCFPDDKNHK